MIVEIITPDKKVFAGEANLVLVPGAKGAFEILNNHAPIISTLGKGRVKVIDSGNTEHFFDIDGGLVENKGNKIIILAESV